MDLEYPYYKLFYHLNKKKVLQDIKQFVPHVYNHNIINQNIEKYDGNYFIIKDIYTKTAYINDITDYFSENIRIHCKFINHPSPFEYWTKYKKDILRKTMEKYKKIDIYSIRETIFYNTKLCNNFRITVALPVLQHFKPKKWLDISAGWGDRLLAAIFYKIKLYVSCDPNLDLHPCYDNMINTFVPPSKRKNFIIYKNGFLEAPFAYSDFDIVFSSPPFFTTEIYSEYPENSVKKHKTEKDWCDHFLLRSLQRAYSLLKKGGHMILYMGGSKYIMDQMHLLLDNLMEYKGQIYFYEKYARGMYVWKKR